MDICRTCSTVERYDLSAPAPAPKDCKRATTGPARGERAPKCRRPACGGGSLILVEALLVVRAGIGYEGLPVKQTGASYRLETIPGHVYALQMTGLIEVGARQVIGMDVGGDGLVAEMEQAIRQAIN